MTTLIFDDLSFYGDDKVTADQAQRAHERRGMGMAYVWGRQDAGESGRDTGYSQTFGNIYAVAQHVTGGYAGPLQAVYHEWHDTGRVLVREPRTRRIVQVAVVDKPNDDTHVQAHLVPYVGGDYGLPYWPGLVKVPS